MIINIIANYFEISENTILSHTETRDINEARDLLIYFLHKKTNLSLAEIGIMIGERSKSTIHRTLIRVKNRIDIYPETKEHIKEIDRLIRMME